jgi:hypothetical protein
MGDALEMGVFQDSHRVEAGHLLAHLAEGGLERAERLHVRPGAHVLVALEDRQSVEVGHGHHRAREPPLLPGPGRAALALDRIGVGIVAGEAVLRRDDVRRDALGHEIGAHREVGVHADGEAVGSHGHPAHHLDPARDIEVADARAHLVGGEVRGLEPGGAEAVDVQPRDPFVPAGGQHGRAGDLAALLADGGDAAPDHVLDRRCVEVVARAQRVEHPGGEREAGHLVQGAVLAPAPAGGAHGIEDVGVRHAASLGRSPRT